MRKGGILTFAGLLAGVLAIAGFGAAPAYAATSHTWIGQGSGLFSDTANWQGGVVPAGTEAELTLPCIADDGSGSPVELTNDLSGVEFSKIIQERGADCAFVNIDTMAFANDAQFMVDYQSNSGSGDSVSYLTIANSSGAEGSLTLGDTSLSDRADPNLQINLGQPLSSDELIVAAGSGGSISGYAEAPSSLSIYPGASVAMNNVPESITQLTVASGIDVYFRGDDVTFDIVLQAGSQISVAPETEWDSETETIKVIDNEVVFKGNITLLGNATYYVSEDASMKITGSIDGEGFALKPSTTPLKSWGDFTNLAKPDNSKTVKGAQVFEKKTLDLTTECKKTENTQTTNGKTSHQFNVGRNQVAILEGKDVCDWGSIHIDGLLKGTGTLQRVYVNGTIAPGNSPGKITLTSSVYFRLNGVYQAEIMNAGSYDQLIVGKDFDASAAGPGGVPSAVSLTNGSLDLVLMPGAVIKKGDTFTIIDNQSDTDVSGTFDDMAEGFEFIIDKAVFKISYKGGDGNDVVLTAQNSVTIPKSPDTGAFIAKAQPAVIAGVAVVMAGLFVAVARVARNRA